MKIVCPKCKRTLTRNWCPDCNLKIGKKKDSEIIDTGICDKCGRRGRLVAQRYLPGSASDRVLCYWCYHEYDKRKGFYIANSPTNVGNEAIIEQEAYLVPLYYGDKPGTFVANSPGEWK